jgi:hypothetical protein
MQRKSVLSAGTGLQWTDQLAEMIEARETEVRESAVLVDVMTAARNQMHMKQIGERQLRIEKRIIGKQALQIPCYPQAAEGTGPRGTVTVTERERWISISHIAVGATMQQAIMIETEEIEKRSEKSSTVGEGTPEEALTSYHTVMIDPVAVGVVELTVMWRALEVQG